MTYKVVYFEGDGGEEDEEKLNKLEKEGWKIITGVISGLAGYLVLHKKEKQRGKR